MVNGLKRTNGKRAGRKWEEDRKATGKRVGKKLVKGPARNTLFKNKKKWYNTYVCRSGTGRSRAGQQASVNV